mmetsp:Transcript_170/g.300  ORF Transcript_170/g.300 Transcript_170/m.300 type:complete len:233 (+) Transcript_170:160-858(+)
MHGEEWFVVRLMMAEKPNTLASSCAGRDAAAAAVLLDFDFDLDAGFFFCSGAGVSISVERMVPTISFSMIRSANCDEWGAWTMFRCNNVFIPWKNRSFRSQKRNSTWIISGSFFFGCDDFCFLALLFVLPFAFDDAASLFRLEFFLDFFLFGSSSSSSELISSSSSSLSLASGFRVKTPSNTKESSSDDESSESSLAYFCCFCSSSFALPTDADAPSPLAVALFDFRFLAMV